jgi:hypothetical protein
MTGVIRDPSGKPVPGATIQVTNAATQGWASTETNELGRYLLKFLIPGKYDLTISAPGFQTYLRRGIGLDIDAHVGVDAWLEVGPASQTMIVSADVSGLETETANRGGAVLPQFIADAPNRGRNLFELVFAMPGAYKPSTSQAVEFGIDAIGNANASINGSAMGLNGRQWNTDILVNGVSDTQGNANLVMTPALASIQEMEVLTNSYDAAYGHSGGGFVNITTKSGANAFHGQLFDRYYSDALAANSWNNNRTGTPKGHAHYNISGLEADGPVRKNLFFMISLERTHTRTLNAYTTTVPLPEMGDGNFSNLRASDGKPVVIYDPLTTRVNPDGITYSRDAFAGNSIPRSRINPVAAAIFAYYPAPTSAGNGPAHTANYNLTAPNETSTPQWLGRLDSRWKRQTAFGEYGETDYTRTGGYQLGGDNPADPTTQNPRGVRGRHLAADWSATLNSATTLDVRAGVARAENLSGTSQQRGFDFKSLGFPRSFVAALPVLFFPQVTIGSYQPLGATPIFTGDDTDGVSVTFSRLAGRHAFRLGGDFRSYRDTSSNPGAGSGSFNFSKAWTQANPQQGDQNSGNEIASFLLGYPAGGSVNVAVNPAWRSGYRVAYVQDDWKIRTNLMVNLGLRYDYETPPVERYNRQNRGFDLGAPSPIAVPVAAAPGTAECPACAHLTGAYRFAGSSGDARYAYEPIRTNFSPRLGFAYQAFSHAVLRGGFGMYRLPLSNPSTYSGASDGFSSSTPLGVFAGDIAPSLTLSNPFPGGLNVPVGTSLGAATDLGLGVSYQYQKAKTPVSYQYSLGMQRELPRGWLMEASYAGNWTRRIGVTVRPDAIPVAYLDRPLPYYTQQVTNPLAGLLPNNASLNRPAVPRAVLLSPVPQYNGVAMNNVPIGQNRYDSLQLVGKHRYANGLTLLASYTISKTLEQLQFLNYEFFRPDDPAASTLDKRLAAFDVPQKASVVGVWELPSRILRGWKAGWNFTFQRGFPVDFPNAAPLTATSAALPSDRRSIYRWFDTSIFPKAAAVTAYSLRNFPSRFPDVRYQGLRNFDVSLIREIPLRERWKLQLRADCTNLTNTPYFTQMQSLDVTNASFGQLKLSQNNDPRAVYLEFKLLF